MQTVNALVDLLLGFVPAAAIISIILALFWIATKLIPELGDWMSETSDLGTDEQFDDHPRYAYHANHR